MKIRINILYIFGFVLRFLCITKIIWSLFSIQYIEYEPPGFQFLYNNIFFSFPHLTKILFEEALLLFFYNNSSNRLKMFIIQFQTWKKNIKPELGLIKKLYTYILFPFKNYFVASYGDLLSLSKFFQIISKYI